MNQLRVLHALAEGRAKLEQESGSRVRVAFMSKRRGDQLREELTSLGVHFGIPLNGVIPHAREEGEWTYLGIVLDDVHVFARVDGA